MHSQHCKLNMVNEKSKQMYCVLDSFHWVPITLHIVKKPNLAKNGEREKKHGTDRVKPTELHHSQYTKDICGSWQSYCDVKLLDCKQHVHLAPNILVDV